MTKRAKTTLWAAVVILSFALGAALAAGTGPAEAAFPGANGRIVFVSERDGNPDVYTMRSNGDDVRRLTSTKGPVENHYPSWSPDGRRIAFTRCESFNARGCDVFVMNADGSGQKNLTRTGRDDLAWSEVQPAWSPDGARIAYQRDAGLWTMKDDGSGKRRVARGYSQYAPAWSPRLPGGGSRIAFSSNDEPCHYLICTVDPEGRDPIKLTATEDLDGYAPSWSPDGGQIAFYSRAFGADDLGIYAANADGTGAVRRLTNAPGEGYDEAYDEDPAWSPDGEKIVFSRDVSRRMPGELWQVGADGTGEARLTTNRTYDGEPDWRPVR